ncbi:2-oxo-4-hydroxy-4-carboxy-5-ureidoimidazoline decarboxylase [Nocardioides sp. TF02-7]|uniref:2-oxo-4-hydroxy-4-carboxy-5-ureidoimidazoline decarboxylase n=1 Tax=Nocardioides sp. TF02-7 TaxID=2917724 RepID=UPI001F070ADB|nr:2-oxo-4-hydroxy-4-carboxy-5-ureidoimidazoline decarboxylase [Nocardioides sp. TF02-7]UMG91466.1 2-oxo-4-hydroxy-4-carboxy-5-ureidoimidazoline decarboxylase [Nocardioides sp. TF02-7]
MRVEELNGLPADEAAAVLRACADVDAWVDRLVRGRPWADRAALLTAADEAARRWTATEVDQALAQHPRIGERPDGDGPAAAQSRSEQAGVDPADTDLAARLAEGNRRYEERFGRIYLVRARGRSGGGAAAAARGAARQRPRHRARGDRRAAAGGRAAPPRGAGRVSTISTHVLDAERGRPAAGMALAFRGPDGTAYDGVTDDDGRFRLAEQVQAGAWSVEFRTGPWFAARERTTFYPEVRVGFTVVPDEHHHVALLLSPYAYTTYRGS